MSDNNVLSASELLAQSAEPFDKACMMVIELEHENERMTSALKRIDAWAKAYPTEVFPEPDFAKANEVLKAAGITLDAISAANMRHVLNGVQEIVHTALVPNVELTGLAPEKGD